MATVNLSAMFGGVERVSARDLKVVSVGPHTKSSMEVVPVMSMIPSTLIRTPFSVASIAHSSSERVKAKVSTSPDWPVCSSSGQIKANVSTSPG